MPENKQGYCMAPLEITAIQANMKAISGLLSHIFK